MAKIKVPLYVVCGCSVDDGKAAFWALDTSDSRLFVVPEKLRVDVLMDRLFDFIGKDLDDDVEIVSTLLSRRGEQILEYISRRREKYDQETRI